MAKEKSGKGSDLAGSKVKDSQEEPWIKSEKLFGTRFSR